MLLNESLLYDQGHLSDLFVKTGCFLVAFLCERSFFETLENNNQPCLQLETGGDRLETRGHRLETNEVAG